MSNEQKPSTARLPRDQKAAETDRAAKAHIEAERKAREKQTDKLRALRLERDAAEAEAAAAAKPKPAKRASTSNKRSK
ncbi:hypothetical protein [Amorphus orientalis]|uniref:Uncharacterized protein n=1 Tax=Amorphus orientalis TaxID=649198 RepID=A0AAE4AW93_9HYPH|nr:hypothetical protein [Amorphus orientalis]MDQ0317534.1 hypothetical protein [Amorphus orientalis]